MPYEFGRQLPFLPPHLNDLNQPLNSFNILATIAVETLQRKGMKKTTAPNHRSRRNRNRYRRTRWTSAQLRDGKHHILRRITIHSTPMMKPGDFFYPPVIPPPPHRKLIRKLSLAMSFLIPSGVSQHVCEVYGQSVPEPDDIPGSSSLN